MAESTQSDPNNTVGVGSNPFPTGAANNQTPPSMGSAEGQELKFHFNNCQDDQERARYIGDLDEEEYRQLMATCPPSEALKIRRIRKHSQASQQAPASRPSPTRRPPAPPANNGHVPPPPAPAEQTAPDQPVVDNDNEPDGTTEPRLPWWFTKLEAFVNRSRAKFLKRYNDGGKEQMANAMSMVVAVILFCLSGIALFVIGIISIPLVLIFVSEHDVLITILIVLLLAGVQGLVGVTLRDRVKGKSKSSQQ